MFRLSFFILFLVNIFSGEVHSAGSATPELIVTINSVETISPTELLIQFQLTNNTSKTVHVLKWGTPLEQAFNHDMFVVKKGDAIVPYTGRMVTRLQPQTDDFVTLQPEESVSQTIDIADGYGIYDAGDYSVMFDSLITVITGETLNLHDINLPWSENRHLVNLKSNEITVTMFTDRERIAAKVDPAFSSCGVNTQHILNNVLTRAEALAEESTNSLISTNLDQRPFAMRYIQWFGSYTAERYERVTDNFTRIHDIAANHQVTFDCLCDYSQISFNTVAYVFPNRPYRIHVCNLFWFDQQPGIVLHEISHFDNIAKTVDHVYGQFNSQYLAEINPDQAIHNADNYLFFAENVPFLPMDSGVVDEIQGLVINQPVTTTIAEDKWVYFKVSGVSRIRLSNMSNDFDLYVKAGEIPSDNNFDCRPYLDDAFDDETCFVSEDETYFIGVKLFAGDNPDFDGGSFTLLADTAPEPIPSPKPGLWWSPEKADGNGFDIQVTESQLIVAWYTYDENGLPVWYLADGSYSNNEGNASIRKYRYESDYPSYQDVGVMQLDFSDTTHAELTWSIDGKDGKQNIEYFSVSDETTITDHTGLWYEPEYPGYGLTIHEQGSTTVAVLYYFNSNGDPLWALGDNNNGYVLNAYLGACPYCAPASTTIEGRIGDMEINFTDLQTGKLTINLDESNFKWRDNVNILNLTR